MLTARRRSLSTPVRRRCCACQQKHIKCEYEKNDEKCKACRANDRKCIVKHRFQHVNPGSKRPRKRANSDRSKDSSKPTEDTNNEQSGGFAVIEWSAEEHAATEFTQNPALEDGNENNQEQEVDQTDDSDEQSDDAAPPAEQPAMNPPPLPSLQSARSTAEDPERLQERSVPASTTPSLPFSTPDFDQFSYSPNLPGPIFSPTTFSAPAAQHTSPLSAVASIPTPEHNRLADKEKAFLLRHFTDVLWKWFDICDPDQHFRRVVPVRALKCPTLMKAICASSAWHLCRQGKYDRERSDFLYENCLRHLIKAMDSPDVGSDDSILIAAVIMHNVEELRDLEHTLMLESRGHLVGISIFLDASDAYWDQNSLRQAALRVAMREELHTCFINQQPLTFPPNLCGIERAFTPANDETWAWRVLLIYRDALAYSIAPSSNGEWDRIHNDLQSWYNLKPETFEPTFYQESNPSEGRILPEIWIVLATSNPKVPKIGWNRAAALKKVDDDVRSNLIDVAGISISNCLLPSAMTAGTMAVTMCAEVVTDQSLQTALFEVFLKAKEVHGWPIEASQAYVRSLWYGEGEIEKTVSFGLMR